MDASSLEISVGESWITVCNGIQHLVFLENEASALPAGPCRGEADARFEGRLRHIESILDDPEDGKL